MAGNKQSIEVRTYKYDGSGHRSWRASILRREGSLLVLDARFETEVRHDVLGTINVGTLSTEFYWLDRWYNIFKFWNASGELINHYCNVNVPPTFEGQVLSYVDLDIDILVEPDFSYRVLDQEEFEQNALKYGYPDHVRKQAYQAVNEIVAMVETRAFPFTDRDQTE